MWLAVVSLSFLSWIVHSAGFTIDSTTKRQQFHCNIVIDELSTTAPEVPSVQCRRSWMASQLKNVIVATGAFSVTKSGPASAVVLDQKAKTQTIDSLTVEQAKDRFLLARKDVQYLLDNYATISKEGGDAVRRYLGTVGVNGAMYGISKVVKKLREEADDIVEFTDAMDEFNAYLYQAEGAAYQSIFAEHSSAKATPESCLATAKQDVVMMAKYMDQLQAQLKI